MHWVHSKENSLICVFLSLIHRIYLRKHPSCSFSENHTFLWATKVGTHRCGHHVPVEERTLDQTAQTKLIENRSATKQAPLVRAHWRSWSGVSRVSVLLVSSLQQQQKQADGVHSFGRCWSRATFSDWLTWSWLSGRRSDICWRDSPAGSFSSDHSSLLHLGDSHREASHGGITWA